MDVHLKFSNLKSFKDLTLQGTPGPAATQLSTQVQTGMESEDVCPSAI